MNDSAYPHVDLVDRFEAMVTALSALAQQLRDSALPIWLPLSEQEQAGAADPRQKAVELYCDLWPRDGGDGRRTRSCHGLIAADPPLLALAQRANQAKDDFRQALSVLKQQLSASEKSTTETATAKQQTDQLLARLNQRPNTLRQALGHKGLARLHLKQCYRLIPSVDHHPQRVGLNWYTSGRSIKRFSQQQAQQALARMGLDKPHIQLQLDRLNQLNADTPLAQVQQQAPLMRANLTFDRAPFRQAMNLSLPLLFGYDPQLPFPAHNDPSLVPQSVRQRQIRSDCRIEPEPFLPSLRLHLYR